MARHESRALVAFVALSGDDAQARLSTFPASPAAEGVPTETLTALVRQTWFDPELEHGGAFVRRATVDEGQTLMLAVAPLGGDAADGAHGLLGVIGPEGRSFAQTQLDYLERVAWRLTRHLQARQELHDVEAASAVPPMWPDTAGEQDGGPGPVAPAGGSPEVPREDAGDVHPSAPPEPWAVAEPLHPNDDSAWPPVAADHGVATYEIPEPDAVPGAAVTDPVVADAAPVTAPAQAFGAPAPGAADESGAPGAGGRAADDPGPWLDDARWQSPGGLVGRGFADLPNREGIRSTPPPAVPPREGGPADGAQWRAAGGPPSATTVEESELPDIFGRPPLESHRPAPDDRIGEGPLGPSGGPPPARRGGSGAWTASDSWNGDLAPTALPPLPPLRTFGSGNGAEGHGAGGPDHVIAIAPAVSASPTRAQWLPAWSDPDADAGLPGLGSFFSRAGRLLAGEPGSPAEVSIFVVGLANAGSGADLRRAVRLAGAALRHQLRHHDPLARVAEAAFATAVGLFPDGARPEAIERRLVDAVRDALSAEPWVDVRTAMIVAGVGDGREADELVAEALEALATSPSRAS